jgi:hypothetical protein
MNVLQVQKIQPFKEIEPNKVQKVIPYEEFWLTEHELKQIQSPIQIMVDGLSFDQPILF